MKTSISTDPENVGDASLVQLSIAGDREAFGRIVSRYQAPICALAYSACGNVSRSEDLAQEIFIVAWRKLSSLREPVRFKAWLYGIARHLIQNAFRQHQRNPVAEAEIWEDAASAAPSGGEPDEQTITKEEETILWHVLSGLPELYRDPMVLFYRQNESVPAVADALAISEDAVRQRLSRGRALLNERVARVVQNGLRHSGPTNSFSLAVVAGLPAFAAAATAKGTVVGMATTQGGKAAGFAGVLKSVGLFAGLVAIPALIGSFIGHMLGGDSEGTGQRRKAAAQFWRLFIRGMVVLLFVPLLLTLGLTGFFHGEARVKFLAVMTVWLGLAYLFVPVALVYWAWQRWRKNAETAESDDDAQTNEMWPLGLVVRNGRRVILLLTVAAGALLVFSYFDMRHDLRRVDALEVKDIIEKNDPQNLDVHISVSHYRSMWGESTDTYRTFLVELTKDGQKTTYLAPVSEDAVSLLARKGIACPVYVQGRDFEILGTPGRYLQFLTAFVLAIGAIFIFKQRRYARMIAR